VTAALSLSRTAKIWPAPQSGGRAAEKILFSLRLSVMNEKPFGNPRTEDIMTEECPTKRTALLSNRKMTCSLRNKADYADFSIIFIPCEILAVLSPWNISSEKLQGITPHPLCR